ncbi:MAG: hypothetical protein ABR517_13980 [Thermoanaerobaculia bacterium]
MLGDLLLELERPEEALAAFEHSLRLYPRRLNSILGAMRAARRTGDEGRARTLAAMLIGAGCDPLAVVPPKRSGHSD